MLDLALSLGGHTHPRTLADAFLRHLRMLAGAREAHLVLSRGTTGFGDTAVSETFASSFDLRRQDDLLQSSDQRLELNGLGHVQLIAAQNAVTDPELPRVLEAFSRSFLACIENERENRQLHGEVERSERAAAARTRLVAETGTEMLGVVDAILSFVQLLEMDHESQPGDHALADEIRHNCVELNRLVRGTLLDGQPTGPERLEVEHRDLGDSRRSGQLRVLVAEDFEPLREMFRLQLEALDCQVDAAADGAEALRLWLTHKHDLVFTDLNMPVMDGTELTRALRFHQGEIGRRLPIIGVTAASEPGELERCRASGMSEILIKPVDLQAIERALHRWTSERSTPNEAADAETVRDGVLEIEQIYRILGEVDRGEALGIIEVFLDTADLGIQRLRDDPDSAARLAAEMHKQKSGARSVGALRYADLCEQIEAKAKREAESLDASNEIARLSLALDDVRERASQLGLGGTVSGPASEHASRAQPLLTSVPRSALIADDDPVMQAQLRALLTSFGVHEVLVAANGNQVREALKRVGGQVDVLLCDLNMPEMDGIELLRTLGRSRYAGAIVLLTGEDSAVLQTAGNLATLHGLRVVGQLGKPVSRGELSVALEQAMSAGAPVSAVQSTLQIAPQAILKGVARGEFITYFQPQVDVHSLRPVGIEALARWRRSDGSFVPPSVFINAAESMELLGQLSEVLLRNALNDGSRVHAAGFPLKIAINLSASWLGAIDLPDLILGLTREAGLTPRDVMLEVTETGVTSDVATAMDVLTRLRLRGFGLSIDDFGIGYSSFEQLRRFPFTELKLDRSFVSHSNRDEASRAILESTMKIASRLGLATVAEGVEVADDLALVRSLGCPVVQGFHLAKPMDTDSLISWLRQRGS